MKLTSIGPLSPSCFTSSLAAGETPQGWTSASVTGQTTVICSRGGSLPDSCGVGGDDPNPDPQRKTHPQPPNGKPGS